METMITVEQARSMIKNHVIPFAAVTMDLHKASGLVLAQDIISNLNIPALPQSNMDGFAFAFSEGKLSYELVGEVAAGSNQPITLKAGTAVRIFTGAVVPEDADTVLMQEKSKLESGKLLILDENLKKGDNVRAVGTEITIGSCALSKGTLLTPRAIGFLAGIGIEKVKAYPKPTVSIIVTGNELQKPGMPLGYGQVYESNSFTLQAALEQQYISNINIVEVKDQLDQLKASLNAAMLKSDIVLMTGGVSVGDYDFTLKAFEQCGVDIVFHKIKQKPGKPLLFGMKDNKLIFGLPGNPASVLTCFYEYVLSAIGILMHQDLTLKKVNATISNDYKKMIGLTHFLKAFYDGEKLSLHLGQESYKLSSYATANCLAVLPENESEIKAGTVLEIHLLP